MPAKWQQWFPFKIEAFKSSPAVRALHPAARAGYIYLLAFAWQTDDCTIPNDSISLAEISELGDELWALHGPRILRKFEIVIARSPSDNGTVTVKRLQNLILHQDWLEAKRVFESRRLSADRTNKHRSPSGDRTVTARPPSRSAYTGTGTVVQEQIQTPLPPSRGAQVENLFESGEPPDTPLHTPVADLQLARIAFASAVDTLHDALLAPSPIGLTKRAGFNDGYQDWQAFRFGDLGLEGVASTAEGALVITVYTPDKAATVRGLDKYKTRWQTALCKAFGRDVQLLLRDAKAGVA
jgi:hypothetical protein